MVQKIDGISTKMLAMRSVIPNAVLHGRKRHET